MKSSCATMRRLSLFLTLLQFSLAQESKADRPTLLRRNVQERQCVLQLNTENCATLTDGFSPVAECGPDACYNFCDDRFVGCCAGDALECSVSCSEQPTTPIITAGCKLVLPPSGTFAPVEPTPPSPPPSPAPRQCVFQQNTQNCTALTDGFSPVAECGPDACYNFCDDRFVGCCAGDALECSVSCSEQPTTPIITAGCKLVLPPSGSFAPVEPTPPSPPPSPAPRQCVFQQNTQNCSALTDGFSPVAECGPDACYNFCDDRFVGCCAGDAFECSVECSEQPTTPIITAGCKLVLPPSGTFAPVEPTPPSPPPSPAPRQCVFQQNTQNCAAVTDGFSPVAECGPDACYNFCDDRFVGCCAGDAFECSVECSEQPTTPIITAGCKLVLPPSGTFAPVEPTPPSPPPSPAPRQCVFQQNTQNCAAVTDGFSPVAECGPDACYNFCDDRFVGCCDGDAFECSVECSAQPTTPIITAGCKLNQSPSNATTATEVAQPAPVESTQPPMPAPVEPAQALPETAPSPAPRQCVLQVNTENCAALTADLEPVAECPPGSCYNFCDDRFQGCCPEDALECSVECSEQPTQPVITAGCQLEQECAYVGQSCSDHSECCSQRCAFGSCRGQVALGRFRAKMSGDRGGAAGDGEADESRVRRHVFRRLENQSRKIRGSSY